MRVGKTEQRPGLGPPHSEAPGKVQRLLVRRPGTLIVALQKLRGSLVGETACRQIVHPGPLGPFDTLRRHSFGGLHVARQVSHRAELQGGSHLLLLAGNGAGDVSRFFESHLRRRRVHRTQQITALIQHLRLSFGIAQRLVDGECPIQFFLELRLSLPAQIDSNPQVRGRILWVLRQRLPVCLERFDALAAFLVHTTQIHQGRRLLGIRSLRR